MALGRTGLRCILQQPLGQSIISTGKSGGNVVLTFHIPDALAHLDKAFYTPVTLAGGVHHRRNIISGQGEGGENTGAT